MKSKTISLFIDTPSSRVYLYTLNPENLPYWVPSFCKSVQFINDEWVVQSPLGRVVFQFAPLNNFGVLDHTVTLSSGTRLINPMRVIPNGEGSEILFTLFQHDGMSDQQFHEDAELVLTDLQSLRQLLESSGDKTCSASN